MKISLIAALASNRVIGLNNQMPWHISADLKKFKLITLGSPILMGRKTFAAIGKPLPGRTNIIISRDLNYQQDGCQVFHDLASALNYAATEAEQLFVIGGATLYEAMLPLADELYLTLINQDFIGDTFFPDWQSAQWQEVAREDIDNDPSVNFSYSFLQLVKITSNS